MIKKFGDFQVHDVYSKKIGLIGEHVDVPEIFGEPSARITIEVLPNEFKTHQVMNRLTGTNFIPTFVANKFSANKIKAPITAILPDSTVKTFVTNRTFNNAQIPKGSIYCKTPNLDSQIQVAARGGTVFGARQIIDGKPVHLDLSRYPNSAALQNIAETLYNTLGSEFLRFRVGLTSTGPQLLVMENFNLKKPELIDLYFNVYEQYVGKIPAWFRHKVYTQQLTPYLNEYINREETLKKCPYIL